MPLPYYVSPEQMMQDKAEYAKKGIAKGRSIIALEYNDGTFSYGGLLRVVAKQDRIDVGSGSIVANSVLVTYEVTDTGRGIAREAQERIFERFVRVTQVEGDHVPGTGLGLSIVKAVVDAHSGSIELGQSPGGGLQIRIQVPQHKVESSI